MPGRPYVPPLPGFSGAERDLATWLLEQLSIYQRDSAAVHQIIASLENDDPADLIAARIAGDWGDVLTGLDRRYADAYQAAATASAADGVPGLGITLPLPQTSYATSWAGEHAGELITNVSEATRQTVTTVIQTALGDGWPVDRTARAIGQAAGLNVRQATALANYRANLTTQGLAPQLAASREQAFSNRLYGQRATMIARTELSAAANAGRYQAWLLGTTSGAIGMDATKEWLAAPGCCPECSALDGVQVGLSEEFPDADTMPPAHPSCRCTAIIVDPGTTMDGMDAEFADEG